MSLNGFLPLTLENSSSSRFWSMPRKIVRSSGPCSTVKLPAGLDALDVLQRHRLHHVDLARQQRRDAGRVVADRREDDLVDVALDLAPLVEVAHQHRAHHGWRSFSRNGPVPLALKLAVFSMPLRRSTGFSALLSSHHFLLISSQRVSVSGRIGNGAVVSISTARSSTLRTSLIGVRVALHVRAVAGGALEA